METKISKRYKLYPENNKWVVETADSKFIFADEKSAKYQLEHWRVEEDEL